MKRSLFFVLALCLVPAVAREWVPFRPGAPERAGEFRVVSSDHNHTLVELDLAGVYVDEVTGNGRTFQTVDFGMAAGGLLTEVGSPQLPVVARFISIPDDRAVRVRVLESDEVSLAGYNVYPAQPPAPENQRSAPFTIDEKRYRTNELYPAVSFRV
ncbi:MAG: C25 family peptidase propeptide domain-containing protein, partial [candidate division WOR-3 bacterium]